MTLQIKKENYAAFTDAVNKHKLLYEKDGKLISVGTCCLKRAWAWIRGYRRDDLISIIADVKDSYESLKGEKELKETRDLLWKFRDRIQNIQSPRRSERPLNLIVAAANEINKKLQPPEPVPFSSPIPVNFRAVPCKRADLLSPTPPPVSPSASSQGSGSPLSRSVSSNESSGKASPTPNQLPSRTPSPVQNSLSSLSASSRDSDSPLPRSVSSNESSGKSKLRCKRVPLPSRTHSPVQSNLSSPSPSSRGSDSPKKQDSPEKDVPASLPNPDTKARIDDGGPVWVDNYFSPEIPDGQEYLAQILIPGLR